MTPLNRAGRILALAGIFSIILFSVLLWYCTELLSFEDSVGDPQILPIVFVLLLLGHIALFLSIFFMRNNAEKWISKFSQRKLTVTLILVCCQPIAFILWFFSWWLFSANYALLFVPGALECFSALFAYIEYSHDIRHYKKYAPPEEAPAETAMAPSEKSPAPQTAEPDQLTDPPVRMNHKIGRILALLGLIPLLVMLWFYQPGLKNTILRPDPASFDFWIYLSLLGTLVQSMAPCLIGFVLLSIRSKPWRSNRSRILLFFSFLSPLLTFLILTAGSVLKWFFLLDSAWVLHFLLLITAWFSCLHDMRKATKKAS